MKVCFLMDNGHKHLVNVDMTHYKDFTELAGVLSSADRFTLRDASINLSKVSLFWEVKE